MSIFCFKKLSQSVELLHNFTQSTSEQTPSILTTTTSGSSRLFIIDQQTKQRFLIDTGADISVLKITDTQGKHRSKSPTKLFAANNSTISTFGKRD